ncbi:MAG: hypothetical protein KC656_37410, partial [Myxococcales bacterium]|nr:hypothetical protein [Myxococcales bacterium]
DEEIALKGGRGEWQGAHDADGDGRIDLNSEYNFGHSQNAGKRDHGARIATHLSENTFEAFLAGRALISAVAGPLDATQMAELRGYRDTIVANWERAIAATLVHYINEVLGDMDAFGSAEYSFRDHAKHWSELKGFSLALQMNPHHSPLSAGDHRALQDWIQQKPVLSNATNSEQEDYRKALLEARGHLQNA